MQAFAHKHDNHESLYKSRRRGDNAHWSNNIFGGTVKGLYKGKSQITTQQARKNRPGKHGNLMTGKFYWAVSVELLCEGQRAYNRNEKCSRYKIGMNRTFSPTQSVSSGTFVRRALGSANCTGWSSALKDAPPSLAAYSESAASTPCWDGHQIPSIVMVVPVRRGFLQYQREH